MADEQTEYVELSAADLAHRWRERTVIESVDEAVAGTAEDKKYATPESALQWLLKLAWNDLQEERRRALNGRWSMACDSQVSRIVGLTRLVGPLPWKHVSVDLILDGVYERIHATMGMPTPLTGEDRQRAREVLDGRWRRG